MMGIFLLFKTSKENCEKTLVSIFINPTQFNNKEDLDKYPKTLEQDILLLKKKMNATYYIAPKNLTYIWQERK